MAKNIMDMTIQDFKSLPYRKWDDDLEKTFNSLVIVPGDSLHDSGYKCMSYAAINNDNTAEYLIGGYSDVLHLDGIGGYGKNYENSIKTQTIPIRGWSIDCLPCGLLRLFCKNPITIGPALSDVDVYGEK